jgi:NADPH:quinone reductase-like Zn-dependent oxidoreductase
MSTHHRVLITRRGGPEVLRLIEEPVPEPGPGELRLRVAATGVAFADVLMREGLYPRAPPLPFSPGYDVVGTIDALGPDCGEWRVGQRVAALVMVGGYAEQLCIAARLAVPVPDGVDAAAAVALVLNFLTAHQMLHRIKRIRAGERVLIHGAAGGVGDALSQLGRLAGLEMYGTASPKKHEALTRFGVVPIDYQSEDFAARIAALTGDGVDAVFDAVGGAQWAASHRCLRAGGMLIGYGFSAATVKGRRSLTQAAAGWLRMPRFDLLGLMPENRAVAGYNVNTLKETRLDWYREDLAALLALLAAGAVQPHIAERLPLAEAARAHTLLNEAAFSGKIVLVND